MSQKRQGDENDDNTKQNQSRATAVNASEIKRNQYDEREPKKRVLVLDACCCFVLCLEPPNVVVSKASSVLRRLSCIAARKKLYVYSLFWAVCCSPRFPNSTPVLAIKYDTLIPQTPCCDSQHIVLRLSTCTYTHQRSESIKSALARDKTEGERRPDI